MIYSVASNPLRTASDLNHDFRTISGKWHLIQSPTRKQTVYHPIFFNGSKDNTATEHKHLGLILDRKLIFSAHVNEKIRKAQVSGNI